MTVFDSRYSLAFSNSQSFKTVATGALTPVITKSELADYLRLPDDADPLLQQICNASTQFIINRLKTELVSRARIVTYPNYPTIGSTSSHSLSRSRQQLKTEILLPYANVIIVQEVKLYGVAITDYQIKQTQPATIELDVIDLIENDEPAIVIEYTAGLGSIEDIPADLKFAITMFAAYVYDNRGCSMADAFMLSGANEMTRTYNTMPVVF
jgi:hypothetical protein